MQKEIRTQKSSIKKLEAETKHSSIEVRTQAISLKRIRKTLRDLASGNLKLMEINRVLGSDEELTEELGTISMFRKHDDPKRDPIHPAQTDVVEDSYNDADFEDEDECINQFDGYEVRQAKSIARQIIQDACHAINRNRFPDEDDGLVLTPNQ